VARAWLTPETIPGTSTCRVLHIPDDEFIIAAVNGALLLLIDPENWEQFGAVTPDEIAAAFTPRVFDWMQSDGGCMLTGMIVPFGGAEAPEGWLLCDGSEVSSEDYPDLFAVIGTVYGAGTPPNGFLLPDLRGRHTLGAGPGPGLTPRSRGQTGGEEAHTLVESEMPSHAHMTHGHFVGVLSGELPVGAAGAEIPSTLTGYAGGGGAHQNMPPFLVVNHVIKT
jgi:microcystin-dependent protein